MLHSYFHFGWILLVLLLASLQAGSSPSPAPNPYPAVISLPARPSPPRQLAPASSSAQWQIKASTTPEIEHDLLPFVIVSTIDGALHAVERDTGKIRWTLRDGVEPLVGGAVRGKNGQEDYIVEPLSGGLYVFDQGENLDEGAETPKVRKLPLSVDQLYVTVVTLFHLRPSDKNSIELSPFTFPHSPSRIFTGSKTSSLITLDLRTGHQLDCFSTLAANSSAESCMCENEQVLDDLEGKSRSNRDILFIGRTDYRLTIHTPPGASAVSGNTIGDAAPGKAGVQEITYSTYTPNSYDKPLAEFWAKMNHHDYQDTDDDSEEEKRVRVELGHDGAAVGVQQGGGVKWVSKLGGVGIAVYDLLLPLHPNTANPILVPQPPPHLPSLFPLPAQPHPSHLDILSKRPTTYIGTVSNLPTVESPPTPQDEAIPDPGTESPDASRLPQRSSRSRPLYYALSSTSYPLIHFAPPPRPGTLTNGSFLLTEDLPERDQLLPYLLDPPAEQKGIPPPEEDRIDRRYVEKEKQSKGWFVFATGVLGTLAIAATMLYGQIRRSTASPANMDVTIESTALLLEKSAAIPPADKERTVTFVEPIALKTENGNLRNTRIVMNGVQESGGESQTVDVEAIPKKKSTRRRVRGKKKSKTDKLGSFDEDGDGDGDDNEEDGNGTPSWRDATSPSKGEKPLPELPREMSAVDLRDQEDKEKLCISDTVIGYGSHGTVVLKGTWGSRPVAVKRLLSDFTRLASQEVKLLQASDDHPHVIRYYCQERRDNFLYIALDLCQASLADLIESPDKHMELASALDRKKGLREVTKGLEHLHGMKIIHRDIKPQNVLVSRLKDGSLRMLVSDFGLARRLDQDQSSFAPTANNLAGSLGWRAPECIRGQVRLSDPFDRSSSGSFGSSSASSSSSLTDLLDASDREADKRGRSKHRLTKAVDLFALGCLYFWVLMSGQHPFGEVYDRESNIVRGDVVNMGLLDILGEEGVEAGEMIGRMLAVDPCMRPETKECLIHPFFWTPAKRLSFLCDASDRFEVMELDPPEPPIIQLEADAIDVVGRDWFSRADRVFTSNLGKYRKYKGNSVRDLLRAMRNKKHHYQDLEPAAKRLFGPLPSGFLFYFTSRYPRLFLHVHKVVKESRLRHESMFEGYFQPGD